MSNDRAVINASPLITLCKSGQEDLLPRLFRELVVPVAVWEEIEAGGADDVAAQKLPSLTWLRRDASMASSPVVQSWDLGAGETAVLSFAHDDPEYVAVVDDAAARRCASGLNIRVIGTLGLIVLAKRRGIIQSVAPGLRALKEAGLWISDDFVARLIAQEDS